MVGVTRATSHIFWLVLAVLGFPLVGALESAGFYEVSRRQSVGRSTRLRAVLPVVWAQRGGQLPWLATIIVITFLSWFFLVHMIFALFLGLSPMTNVTSGLDVYFTPEGLSILSFGSVVGAIFAVAVFSISILGMPMILDRDVDFMSAMLRSAAAVKGHPVTWLIWGAFIALLTLLAMVPFFLGLFIAMSLPGHATWHLYKAVSDP